MNPVTLAEKFVRELAPPFEERDSLDEEIYTISRAFLDLHEAGADLATIVRGYGGHNALVMLTQKQIEWLNRELGMYPAAHDMAAGINGELHRAALMPLAERRPPGPHEAVAAWENASGEVPVRSQEGDSE